MAASDEPRPTQAKKRRLQFGLRSIILLTFVVAVSLSIYRRHNAYMAFDAIQGRAEYVRPEPTAKGWQRLYDDSIYQVHHLSFHSIHDVDDGDVAHVSKLPSLRRLSLHRTSVTDKSAKYISGLTKLEALSFQQTAITDDGLKHLRGLKNLKSLSLRGTNITDNGLKHLAPLTNLEELLLDRTQISVVGLKNLGEKKNLRRLEMVGASMPSVPAWPLFAKLPALEKLSVPWAMPICNEDAPYLRKLASLRELHNPVFTSFQQADSFQELRELNAGATGDVRIEHVPKLQRVTLSSSLYSNLGIATRIQVAYCHALERASIQANTADCVLTDCRRVKRADLRSTKRIKAARLPNLNHLVVIGQGHMTPVQLRTLPKLQQLTATACKLEPESWAALAESNQLRRLYFLSCPIDEGSIKHFSKLTKLEELTLPPENDIPAKHRDLSFLQNAKRLRVLCALSILDAKGIKHISELAELRRLRISSAHFEKGSMDSFSRLKHLQHLEINYASFEEGEFEKLGQLQSLESLALSLSNPTQDRNVLSLKTLKKLKDLYLHPLKSGDVDTLLTHLPQLETLNGVDTDDTASMKSLKQSVKKMLDDREGDLNPEELIPELVAPER